jgi:hypothetical protein
MTTTDPDALARLALWARFCCAHIRRPWLKFSGFNASEWSRLLELAAAVDRRTLLRFAGVEALLMAANSVIGALLVVALIFMTFPLTQSSLQMAVLTTLAGTIAIAAMPLCYRVAAHFAAHGGLADRVTAKPGDAELVAKVRRQNVWGMGVASAVMILVLFVAGLFSASLRPLSDQWAWLLLWLAALSMADFVWRIWRGPRSHQQ